MIIIVVFHYTPTTKDYLYLNVLICAFQIGSVSSFNCHWIFVKCPYTCLSCWLTFSNWTIFWRVFLCFSSTVHSSSSEHSIGYNRFSGQSFIFFLMVGETLLSVFADPYFLSVMLLIPQLPLGRSSLIRTIWPALAVVDICILKFNE